MLAGLAANNITNSMTYSLYLSPLSLSEPEQAASQIIFGGIDPSLYQGTLYEFESLRDDFYFTQLSGINVTSTGESLFHNDEPYSILVDSGTIQIILPEDQANSIGALASATYHSSSTSLLDNYFVCNCDDVPSDDSLTFTFFGALEIQIPWNDIVNRDTGVDGQCIIPISYAQHAGGGILVSCPRDD
jgi:hypothetical protein